MRTIEVKVDLQCCRCSAKIRKVLTCSQERKEFSINKIIYDEKDNKVTISGPFDPEKLKETLYCKAGKIIKGIEVLPLPKEKPKKESPPKVESKKEPLSKEESKKQPPPCKLLLYPCPYPLPYPCPTWPWGCSDNCGHGGCHCCSRPPPPQPPPPKPLPCSYPSRPSGCCDDHGHSGCHCCPKPKPFLPYHLPAPWCKYKFISEENPSYGCSTM